MAHDLKWHDNVHIWPEADLERHTTATQLDGKVMAYLSSTRMPGRWGIGCGMESDRPGGSSR